MGRHLTIHLGGALAAAVVACAVPLLATALLGQGWAFLGVVFALAVPALLVGFSAKVLRWMRAPVPFRIPLTVGQQRSLASIPHDGTGNPHTTGQVLLRALLDVVLFRPLTRTTPTARTLSPALDHGTTRSLWLAAMLFHGSLAVIGVRHLRLFLEPVPGFVAWLENADAVGEMTLPKLHVSSVALVLALLYLLGRRLWLAKLRYISVAADYFPLFLLIALATTGLVMRHFIRTDVPAVKGLVTGLANGAVILPAKADAFLVVHLFLLGVLLAYFPFSKLMHMPGVWLSPTLTLANSTRQRRHVNPNNPKVETLHYADYEDAFRGPMLEAGLPVEKE
jgi:nitrate reductase gamma subunit